MGIRETLFGPRQQPIQEEVVAPITEIEEATRSVVFEPIANLPQRQGYEYGISRGGTDSYTSWNQDDRKQHLEELYDAYIGCNWVSVCIDTIARSVTAGGLIVTPDDEIEEGEQPPDTPEVIELKRLLMFTNPREDMIQLMRSTIIDLLVFGDAFIEVSTALGKPVALYTLDCTTMTIDADEHGVITGYTQRMDTNRKADFEPEDIIHISLDAPRGGLYGVSPTQKALIPIKTYLFTAACLKENMRRGNPPRMFFDLPRDSKDKDKQKFWENYMSRNLGPRNIGTPIMGIGGVNSHELSSNKVEDFIRAKDESRDEILSVFGVPPSKADIIESGNLGGGTGEAQDKTFRVQTIIPIQNLLLEKLNYSLAQSGFGITGWHLEFEEIDFRDSTVVENIRIMRLTHGAYTFNRYRAEIGEPPIPGGDEAMILDRGKFVYIKDMAAFTQAEMNQMNAPLVAAGDQVNPTTGIPGSDPEASPPAVGVQPTGTERPKAPVVVMPSGMHPGNVPPGAHPGGPNDAEQGQPPKETRGPDEEMRALTESFRKAYQHRRKRALKELHKDSTQ